MSGKKLTLFVVAGEASGDLHAANLVKALRKEYADGEIEFFGSAGPRMREAGVEPVVWADDLAIIGLAEIGMALPQFLKAFIALKRSVREMKPDAAILVDFPDFNLKLVKWLKKRGIKVVYYISPQLWAWRSYRVRMIKKYVDLMITILPFEKVWYASKDFINLEYVGHPLATEVHSGSTKADFCKRHGLNCESPVIALLPGSRLKEVTRILPNMLAASRRIAVDRPDVQFVIAATNEASASTIRAMGRDGKTIVVGETHDALNAADAAAVASG